MSLLDTFEDVAEWQEQGLCRGYDNIIFFGDEGESELEKQGREDVRGGRLAGSR